MKLDLKKYIFLLDMFLIVGGGGCSSNRNASRDESVEAGDKSVEAGDESIEAGEKTPQSCYKCIHKADFITAIKSQPSRVAIVSVATRLGCAFVVVHTIFLWHLLHIKRFEIYVTLLQSFNCLITNLW